jgi:hypothetical protein
MSLPGRPGAMWVAHDRCSSPVSFGPSVPDEPMKRDLRDPFSWQGPGLRRYRVRDLG